MYIAHLHRYCTVQCTIIIISTQILQLCIEGTRNVCWLEIDCACMANTIVMANNSTLLIHNVFKIVGEVGRGEVG